METEERNSHFGRTMAVPVSGVILSIVLILVTLEIAHRGLIALVASEQKYIISAETALLGVFLTEALARGSSYGLRARDRQHAGARLRLTIRIVCYTILLVSVVSILASNPALGISVGAVAGVVIAFATQSIIANVLAAILIFNTHMVRIGEEITVVGVSGTVSDIRLAHTLVRSGDEVVYIPNSVMLSNAVRRKVRTKGDEHPGSS
ncbi:MAG TPA: mechanosensitive ion channel domain-containing protein, partial [bacterium]|nr:mechanosensitive ion channel domain-containing protein [bacterium]